MHRAVYTVCMEKSIVRITDYRIWDQSQKTNNQKNNTKNNGGSFCAHDFKFVFSN